MSNLIKMDFRRMSRATMLKVLLIIIAAMNLLMGFAAPLILNLIPNATEIKPEPLSNIISDPFGIPMLILLVLISVVSFSYADFSGGFIKNIAGQVGNKSKLVISKFVVIGIHNLIFLLVGSASRVLGAFVGTAFGGKIEFDALIPAAFGTLLIKWMLLMGISAILLFITTGLRSKTFAVIIGVVIGTGALGLVYMGINFAIEGIFKIKDFSISDFMPDQLVSSVNLGSGTLVWNSIIVAVVCTAIFLPLAIKVFKSRDIK